MKPSNIDQAIHSVLELRAHQGQLTENVLAVNEDYTPDIPLDVDVAPQNVDIYQRQAILAEYDESSQQRYKKDATITFFLSTNCYFQHR